MIKGNTTTTTTNEETENLIIDDDNDNNMTSRSASPAPPRPPSSGDAVSVSPAGGSKAVSAFTSNANNFKLLLLVGMVLQNSSVVLVGRYTRSAVPKDQLYSVNHLIFIVEVMKFIMSAALEFRTTNGLLIQSIRTHVLDRPMDALKISIPALLYLTQNTLLYVALSNLTAPIFQVTYQCKLVTTAIVSVLLLNRKYKFQQWICLVCLSIGVAIVVLGEKKDDKKQEADDGTKPQTQNLALGLISVGIACFCSAMAGVYFEMVIKKPAAQEENADKTPAASLWMRNMQLSFYSLVIAYIQGMIEKSKADPDDLSDVNNKEYFFGFTIYVWIVVWLQAGGGLLVAAVIKYADNVLKGLATGVSIVAATTFSILFLGTELSFQFFVGAVMILGSVYVFSNPITFNSKKSVLPL